MIMTIDEMIAVLQAAKARKQIQFRFRVDQMQLKKCEWEDCETPGWNFGDCEYRVKPEPRTVWVNEYPDHCGDTAYDTKLHATNAAGRFVVRRAVKFVEVIE